MCQTDCKASKSIHPDRGVGIWSGFLLLLIPKCPFCFMAFSSVLVICGETGPGHSARNFYSTTTLILTTAFCVTALLSIILYYRPDRGKYALLLTIPGITALLLSVTMGGGIYMYYTGAGAVLAGLLRNSGFWSLLERKLSLRKDLPADYAG